MAKSKAKQSTKGKAPPGKAHLKGLDSDSQRFSNGGGASRYAAMIEAAGLAPQHTQDSKAMIRGLSAVLSHRLYELREKGAKAFATGIRELMLEQGKVEKKPYSRTIPTETLVKFVRRQTPEINEMMKVSKGARAKIRTAPLATVLERLTHPQSRHSLALAHRHRATRAGGRHSGAGGVHGEPGGGREEGRGRGGRALGLGG
jgi:hypothetical protein